jgi:hypothetical protein
MLEDALAGLAPRRPAGRFGQRRLAAAAAGLLLLAGGTWLAGRSLFGGAPFQPYELAVKREQPAAFKDVEGAKLCARAASRVSVVGPRALRLAGGAILVKVEPGRGDFRVEVPDGVVSVLGTEFSVSLVETSARVAVRSGRVRLANAGGSLSLTPGGAGEIKAGSGQAAPPAPTALPEVNVAGETLWRPWSWLDADERAERLEHLGALLGGEDYDVRVAARERLTEAGEDGLEAAISWTCAGTPRLRLEAVLFLRSAPADHAEARAALEEVVADRREQAGIRDQARVSLDELKRRAKEGAGAP